MSAAYGDGSKSLAFDELSLAVGFVVFLIGVLNPVSHYGLYQG